MSGGGRILKDKSDEKFTFFKNSKKGRVKFKNIPYKKAFSVAEAMITLLIVSVALAAAAPMMSKRVLQSQRQTQYQPIPKGAVIFFNVAPSKCPAGWERMIDENPAWAGKYFRIAGKDNVGQWQDSAIPNIKATLSGARDYGLFDNGSGAIKVSNFTWEWDNNLGGAWLQTKPERDSISWNDAKFDASAYNSIYKDSVNEVRPPSVALLACQKL